MKHPSRNKSEAEMKIKTNTETKIKIEVNKETETRIVPKIQSYLKTETKIKIRLKIIPNPIIFGNIALRSASGFVNTKLLEKSYFIKF